MAGTRARRERHSHRTHRDVERGGSNINAPMRSEWRPVQLVSPYVGPRTPDEWRAAFAEMYREDETYRELVGEARLADLTFGTSVDVVDQAREDVA